MRLLHHNSCKLRRKDATFERRRRHGVLGLDHTTILTLIITHTHCTSNYRLSSPMRPSNDCARERCPDVPTPRLGDSGLLIRRLVRPSRRVSSLRAMPKRWLPLEANPDVMNAFARQLGLAPTLAFHDVFGFDDELLWDFIPQPCVAVLMLFPITDATGRVTGNGATEWFERRRRVVRETDGVERVRDDGRDYADANGRRRDDSGELL